jgi:hypothetical protein
MYDCVTVKTKRQKDGKSVAIKKSHRERINNKTGQLQKKRLTGFLMNKQKSLCVKLKAQHPQKCQSQEKALAMLIKSSGFNEAPPIHPPSMSLCLNSSDA